MPKATGYGRWWWLDAYVARVDGQSAAAGYARRHDLREHQQRRHPFDRRAGIPDYSSPDGNEVVNADGRTGGAVASASCPAIVRLPDRHELYAAR